MTGESKRLSAPDKGLIGRIAVDLIFPAGEVFESLLAPFSRKSSSSRLVRSQSEHSADGEDVYAKILRSTCAALGIEAGALLLSNRAQDQHYLSAYINLSPNLLQLISESGGWMGLERHVESMAPVLLDLDPTTSRSSPYRTAMSLFGYRALGAIPFLATTSQQALLMLPIAHRLDEGERDLLHEGLDLVQRQIQLAMDHLALQNRDRHRSRRLKAVKEGLRQLTSATHPSEVLQTTCEQIRQIFECTVVWIGLGGVDALLSPTTLSGAPWELLEAFDPAHFEPGGSLAVVAQEEREVLLRHGGARHLLRPSAWIEVMEDPAHPLNHLVNPDALEVTLMVPLVSAGERLGVLILHRDRPYRMGREDRDVLRIFADQAALAIKTSRLLKQTEERSTSLAASEGLYRSFVRQLSDGLFRLDKLGRVVELSDSAVELFGVERQEVLGKPLLKRFARRDAAALREAIDRGLEGRSQELTLKIRRDDERPVVVVLKIGPLITSGEVVGIIGVARDNTDRMAMQSKLLARERQASVGMMAAGLAHEINNPLAFMMSNIETLLESLEPGATPIPSAEFGDMLRESREGAMRIRDIASHLRELSQHGGPESHRDTDLIPLIESTAWLVHPEARYSGQLNLELGELPRVQCSPNQIAQMLIQLILNAIQALPPADSAERSITLRARSIGEIVEIEIEDKGAGISRKELPKVVEPFFTTRRPEDGAGLGLVMCQEVVQNHGGQLHIQTEAGVGTRVVIRLPVNGDKAKAMAPSLLLEYGDEILDDSDLSLP